jgi:hypothetical protein
VPKFEADASAAAELRAGTIPASLQSGFDANGLKLPDDAVVTSRGADGPWQIGKEGAPPALVIRAAKNAAGADVLQVDAHSAGWIENLWSNTVAFMAMCLVATILVFLLLLINIAGKRWEQEGRLPAEG